MKMMTIGQRHGAILALFRKMSPMYSWPVPIDENLYGQCYVHKPTI